eukprot:812542-Pleurochrysis_carterae.AAC.1
MFHRNQASSTISWYQAGRNHRQAHERLAREAGVEHVSSARGPSDWLDSSRSSSDEHKPVQAYSY